MASIENDKINEVLAQLELKKQASLEAIGAQAAAYAADKSPVRTGRLRASMAHRVVPDEDSVQIGTNVEYAIYQELGTSKFEGHHMLRNAVANHTDEYKRLVEMIFKG